jgi:high affinity Mn2+ porin
MIRRTNSIGVITILLVHVILSPWYIYVAVFKSLHLLLLCVRASMIRIRKYVHTIALLPITAACISLLCVFSCISDVRADDENAVTPSSQPSEQSIEQDALENEQWAVHGQLTNITQLNSHFTSPYSGPNSLNPNGPTEETTDLTLFAGRRLWSSAELWLNSEIDQGFGLDNTLGIAGFPSGGAYKIGADAPYLRIPRVFIRQVIPLGGTQEKVEPAANQLGGAQASDNLTLTVGKFSVVDIFDANSYAHDPRADFLNWSVIDAGAFDYAADSWGYTYGTAAEWSQGWWTLRGGIFQMSNVPNGKITAVDFNEYSVVGEMEARHQWLSHPGKLKLLAFVNRARMANYADAVQLARETGGTPDVSLVRHYSSRPGIAFNMEQELSSDIDAFARFSANDGSKEAYEFSDINQSLSSGLSIKGDRWERHDDTIGVSAVVNRLSGAAQEYFAAGGLGILIGDGRLNYAPEEIAEMYYSLNLRAHLAFTFDYQYIVNPAYNHDRGPVSIYGARFHADF